MAVYTFAPYEPAVRCTPNAGIGVFYFAAFLEEQIPESRLLNVYSCRDIVGGNDPSHHAEKRADDQGVPQTRAQIGKKIMELVGPYGAQLGIDHSIVNYAPWMSGRGDPRIFTRAYPKGRYYSGLHPHKDHNHHGFTRWARENLTLTYIRRIVLGTQTEEPGEGTDTSMLPFKKGQRSEDIRWFKDRMNETFDGTTNPAGVTYKKLDIADDEWGDVFEDATQNRVRDFLGAGFTGHPDGIKGTWVGGQQFNALEILWLRRKLGV